MNVSPLLRTDHSSSVKGRSGMMANTRQGLGPGLGVELELGFHTCFRILVRSIRVPSRIKAALAMFEIKAITNSWPQRGLTLPAPAWTRTPGPSVDSNSRPQRGLALLPPACTRTPGPSVHSN
eukprot:g28273.t1